MGARARPNILGAWKCEGIVRDVGRWRRRGRGNREEGHGAPPLGQEDGDNREHRIVRRTARDLTPPSTRFAANAELYLYAPGKRERRWIRVNGWVCTTLNSGVYRSGFAIIQWAHAAAVHLLTLRSIESNLCCKTQPFPDRRRHRRGRCEAVRNVAERFYEVFTRCTSRPQHPDRRPSSPGGSGVPPEDLPGGGSSGNVCYTGPDQGAQLPLSRPSSTGSPSCQAGPTLFGSPEEHDVPKD